MYQPEYENEGPENYGDFTAEQINRVLGYYVLAQNSLTLLANFSEGSPLHLIGTTAKRIIESGQILQNLAEGDVVDISKVIALDLADPARTDDQLLSFVLVPDEEARDDDSELAPLKALLQLNVEGILAMEDQKMTPKEIQDRLEISLIGQNHSAGAYLDGRIAKDGINRIVREAVVLQHEYEQSPIGGPTHTKIKPQELTQTMVEERTKKILGARYFTDVTFADFQAAAKKALQKVKSAQNKAQKLNFEDEEDRILLYAQLDAQQLYLDTIFSDDPESQQFGLNKLTRAVCSGAFMNGVTDVILESFMTVIAKEKGSRRQAKSFRLPTFDQNINNRAEAMERFHEMPEKKRRILTANVILGFLVNESSDQALAEFDIIQDIEE